MQTSDDESQSEVSLFPMFNILVSTLGVLIFILGTVSTISLGVGRSVLIMPELAGAEPHGKTPTYVEWNGTQLILHPSRDSVSMGGNLRDIQTYRETYAHIDSVIDGTPFDSLFQRLGARRDDEYVVILVRPSGFESLADIRGYIESKGLDLGYEPINQEWQINLR